MRNQKIIVSMIILAAVCVVMVPTNAFTSYEDAKRTVQMAAQPFADQGYYMGNKYNSGVLATGKSDYMSVHLFKGNRYIFIAGTPDDNDDMDVMVFDENLALVAKDDKVDNVAFVQYSPDASGIYKIKITMAKTSGRGSDWCFTMGYW